MIAYLPKNTLSDPLIMNLTVRFPINEAYTIIFRFRKADLVTNESYIYFKFDSSDVNSVSASEMIFAEGKLSDQVPENGILGTHIDFINAESYDEYKLSTVKYTDFWQKNSIYHLDVYLNASEDLSKYEHHSQSYFHTFVS